MEKSFTGKIGEDISKFNEYCIPIREDIYASGDHKLKLFHKKIDNEGKIWNCSIVLSLA